MMTRKHYIAIAAIFAAERRRILTETRVGHPRSAALETLDNLLDAQVEVFAADNSNFNRQRFIDAARRA
jgi:hypothetical protein